PGGVGPTPERPSVVSETLADGHPARMVRAFLAPRQDEQSPPHSSGRRVTVAVARPTNEIVATLHTLDLLLWGLASATLMLAALATVFAIRGGLRPLAQLSAGVDAIDAGRLGERLSIHGLPRELQPTVDKLNELLARLETAFARERQFSADVSHELRTPL